MKKSILLLLLIFSSLIAEKNFIVFSNAKRKLQYMYLNAPTEFKKGFYCGCEINFNTKIIITENCKLKARKNIKRSIRLEWEHVVPASRLGGDFSCWINKIENKGRRANCSENDKLFQEMEGDLHNLQPAEGELNADRNNFSFFDVNNEERIYGDCDFEINRKSRQIEPKDNIKGDIARTFFYMNYQYGLKLNNEEIKMYNEWSKLDPVDDYEIWRNNMIEKLQGNKNPFIK